MNRIALIAGAATGLVLALVVGGMLGRRAAPKPVATQLVHAGSASLVVPRDWHPVSATASAAILEVSGRRAVVKLGPVRTPAGSARATMLAGYRAWREGTVTVLPTSTGVVTVDCTTCTDAIQTISVRGAAILDPTPDLALALRAPDVVANLDRARVRGRDELRQATTPADQSRWARRLAAAHASAAAALRPVSGPDLLERFADVHGAYSDLAVAATAGSAEGFDAARARIRTAETKLTRSLGDIAPPPVQPRAATPAPVARHEVPRPLLALVIFVFAGLGAGLALSTGRRRAEPAPAVQAPTPPPAPPWLAALKAAPPHRSGHQWPARAVSSTGQPVANGWATGPRAARPAMNAQSTARATPGPVASRPAVERPAAQWPATDRPTAERRPAAERPAAQRPATERAAMERPAAERPGTERPPVHEPLLEPLAAERPVPSDRVLEPLAAASPVPSDRVSARPTAEHPEPSDRALERPAAASPVASDHVSEPPAAASPAASDRVLEPRAPASAAASHRVLERPAAKRPAARREVPVPPGTTWTCELAWSANLRRAGFRVQATAAGEGPVEVARSRKVNWPPLMPPAPQAELVAAARSVAKALVEAGWTPTTKGSDWYAQRFAWTRDGSPPTLGTI